MNPPKLVSRPNYDRWGVPYDVADFSEEKRPAYRVGCHCRNCSWKGEARSAVGQEIPQWVMCPKCETLELSAHGEFKGRDEVSREQERKDYVEYLERRREHQKAIGVGGLL